MADDLLYRCCEQLLEVASDSLDTPPERSYIHATEPVDSCAHLVVWCRELGGATLSSALGRQTPSLPTTKTMQVTARFQVQQMLDCWPVFAENGAAPTPDAISAAAERVLTDRMDLAEGLRAAAADGSMFSGILGHGRDGVGVTGPHIVSPQSGGGLMGHRFDVHVQLLRLPG